MTPWTVARQALPIVFPRQEYWSGLSFPSPCKGTNPTFMVEGTRPFPVWIPIAQVSLHPLSLGTTRNAASVLGCRKFQVYVVNFQGLCPFLDQFSLILSADTFKVTLLPLTIITSYSFTWVLLCLSHFLPYFSLFHFVLTPNFFFSEQRNKSLYFSSHSSACNFREMIMGSRGREIKNRKNAYSD